MTRVTDPGHRCGTCSGDGYVESIADEGRCPTCDGHGTVWSIGENEMSLARERLADYAHQAWSGWMQYVFDVSQRKSDGTVTVPGWAVERWSRQLATPYLCLPTEEQASDLKEADRMLVAIFGRHDKTKETA